MQLYERTIDIGLCLPTESRRVAESAANRSADVTDTMRRVSGSQKLETLIARLCRNRLRIYRQL